MIIGIYDVLGVFLMRAAKNPLAIGDCGSARADKYTRRYRGTLSRRLCAMGFYAEKERDINGGLITLKLLE